MRLGKPSASKQNEITGNEFTFSRAIADKMNKIYEDIGFQAMKSVIPEMKNKQR